MSRDAIVNAEEILEAIAALVLANQLHDVHNTLEAIMADLTNLNNAVAALQSEVTAVVDAIGSSKTDQAGVDAATAAVTQATTDLTNAVAPPAV